MFLCTSNIDWWINTIELLEKSWNIKAELKPTLKKNLTLTKPPPPIPPPFSRLLTTVAIQAAENHGNE